MSSECTVCTNGQIRSRHLKPHSAAGLREKRLPLVAEAGMVDAPRGHREGEGPKCSLTPSPAQTYVV